MISPQKFKSLNAVTATGAGSAVDAGYWTKHGVQLVWNGSPSAYQVDLEGTIDGTTWVTIGTLTQAEPRLSLPFQAAVLMLRLNLVSFTGGTDLTGYIFSVAN